MIHPVVALTRRACCSTTIMPGKTNGNSWTVSGAYERLIEQARRAFAESGVDASLDEMLEAGAALLARARRAGVIRAEVQDADVLRMIGAIAWAVQDSPDRAEPLLALLLHGLRSPGGDVLHPELARLDQDEQRPRS